jgi:hypothetical protein
MKMKRFVPGVDSYLSSGIPASLMRFSESDAGEVESRHPSAVSYISLIMERPVTLNDKYRQLCYWRLVVNAENS